MNRMLRHRIWSPFAALALLVCGASVARSETIDITSGSWTTSVLVRPTSLEVNDLFATTAGTVTLSTLDVYTLTHQLWGDALTSLNTSIQTFTGQQLLLTGDATTVFEIGANERFSTSTYSSVLGAGIGAYLLDVRFTPKIAAVPLPLGAWLLLSGFGLLAGRARRSPSGEAVAT